MSKKSEAARLLVHYIEVAWRRAGVEWDADNTAEIEELVDAIIDAAVEEVRTQYLEPQR